MRPGWQNEEDLSRRGKGHWHIAKHPGARIEAWERYQLLVPEGYQPLNQGHDNFSIYNVGADASKNFWNLAPEDYIRFSDDKADEDEPQPEQWPAEARCYVQDNIQSHIPLHQHWTKGFGSSTGLRLQTRSRAAGRSFESDHSEHVNQGIDS